MAEIPSPHTIEGFRCDFTGCDEEIRLEIPMYSWTNTARQELIANHWTRWAGRSTRHYCSRHQPKPGHKMRQTL